VKLERPPKRDQPCQVPQRLEDGFIRVDPSWGEVQPIELAPGVRTIGERELLDHIEQGLPVIDTRLRHFRAEATIPGARGISHEEILEHRDHLDPERPTVFFCNGPQCIATPDAIATLLDAGYPAASILYYRGGIHDWMTLGYPTIPER
jgi:rhodanese-related sulfurtransferase